LANVFRGQLTSGVVSDEELFNFVKNFGPVQGPEQQEKWVLFDEPEATQNWITYSKYNMNRTKELRNHWEKVFNRIIREDAEKSTKINLYLFLLNPLKMLHLKDWNWIQQVPDLEGKYSFILQAILEELLSQTPIPTGRITEYLCQMEKWLAKYIPTNRLSTSYRYSMIFILAKRLHIVKIRVEKPLNDAVAKIIKNYIININHEYLTNSIAAEIKRLSTQIVWSPSDLKDMSASLFNYVQVEENKFRPVLFELFLRFVRSGEIEEFSEKRILDTYWKICVHNSGFYGLTYTSYELFEYLKWIKQRNFFKFRHIVTETCDYLTGDKLKQFMQSTAYPDFLSRFLRSLVILQIEINAEKVLGLIRPLITNFYDSQPTKYIFREVKRLKCRDLRPSLHLVKDDPGRQIRLCLAEKINLSLDLVLKDFTELLEAGKITIPTHLCNAMTFYLKSKKKSEVSEALVEDYRRRIYSWLRQNEDKDESLSVLKIIENDILFSNDLKGFERIIEHSIEVGYIPFRYLEWWLKEEQAKISTKQRYAFLDAFWNYILENSDENESEKYNSYNRFLWLVEFYGISQDLKWWDRAVQKLLKFYDRSVIRSHFKPKWIKRKGKTILERKMLYDQRCCMDQIMISILHSYSLLDESLRDDFLQRIGEGLKPYENQLWAIRWIAQVNLDTKIDGTRLFLDYISSLEERSQGIQSDDILNQTRWWFEWIKTSKQEISIEFNKIWHYLDQIHPPPVSIFLIPAFFKVCPETLHHFEIGLLVKNMLEKIKYDFKSKSLLISDYFEWLKIYD